MKETHVTFLKINDTGYVSIESDKVFDTLSQELRDMSKDEDEVKVGIELLVKCGEQIKKYDEAIKIYSASALSTSFLESVITNINVTETKQECKSDKYKW